MKSASGITEVKQNVYLLRGEKPGSHVYLIKGTNKNMLIDTGIAANFSKLEAQLREIGLNSGDINLVMLSHEHFDHIGASSFFCDTSIVAAHFLAANKIMLKDEFVTQNKYRDIITKPLAVHLWLEDGAVIDLGSYRLQILHTPGHTSGCVCIYEPDKKLLFSGDTVFAGGTLSEIATSGNISDYVSSLRRLSSLHISELYPAHGDISLKAEEHIKEAVRYAEGIMEDSKVLFDAMAKTESRRKVFDRMLTMPWSGIIREKKESRKKD